MRLILKKLKQYDTKEMYKIYNEWPKIAIDSFNLNIEKIEIQKVDHIVFAGMGGSGAIGDVFASILSKTTIHTTVVKGYTLPKTVNKNTLVVIISVSGDTKETFEILKLANKTKCKIIAFSSGGKIEKFCISNNLQYRKIKKTHSPRASFPIFLYGILKVLKPILPISNKEVNESINQLKKTFSLISTNNISKTNLALELAKWITEIPIIYYPFGFESAAIRFKNSLQENAKTHVICEDVLETTHNGIVAWEKKSKIKPILLRGTNDHIKTKERWKIMKKYLNFKKIDYREIESPKGGILSKLVNLIYVLDYTSIYYSVMNNTDPSPVEAIDFFKSKLKK
jgi:glucose/mannose-6-phosphate isomerase